MCSPELSLWRLRVIADADPGALARVVERFQNLNVLPRRVVAEFGTDYTLHIQIDVFGLPEQHLVSIAAKISQATSICSAYWHRV
jgi:hypothetical protein